MEQNTEKKTLAFGKGMTNSPGDLLSEDTELVESLGFVYKDGEMKAIQKPKLLFANDEDDDFIKGKLLYVHKGADFENHIYYDEDFDNGDGSPKGALYAYIITEDGTYTIRDVILYGCVVYEVCGIGNTLVCTTDKGLRYILFKSGGYKRLEGGLPKYSNMLVNIDMFDLISKNDLKNGDRCVFGSGLTGHYNILQKDSDGNITGLKETDNNNSHDPYAYTILFYKTKEYNWSDFQTAVQGHVAAMIREAKVANKFIFPFFIRIALKLFDGSYARISNPILCFPVVRKNGRMVPTIWDNGYLRPTDIVFDFKTTEEDKDKAFRFWLLGGELTIKMRLDNFSGWEDIVKEIVVFASDDVMPFYLDKDWTLAQPFETDIPDSTIVDPLGGFYIQNKNMYWRGSKRAYNLSTGYRPTTSIIPQYKSDDAIKKELLTKTQFYKLFSVKISDIDTQSTFTMQASNYMEDSVLENLTVQEQLQVDDYYGWNEISANKLYPYNRRLNIFEVKRMSFKGFNIHIGDTGTPTTTRHQLEFYTHISSEQKSYWVKSDRTPNQVNDYVSSWFYYPDPNADKVVIVDWSKLYEDGTPHMIYLDLIVHPYLNGAYAMDYLPLATNTKYMQYKDPVPTVDENTYEIIDSQIFTSVVNNPFVFEASGDNTVGTGSILGIVANTEAISQGQFGQYPLFVFTTEGIYAMSVNSEGLYSNIYPVSREVCNNAASITPTDKLVYFTSDKGLMAISGGSVVCVSEQMGGRTPRNFSSFGQQKFLDFLKTCQIAYDYRDSMLRLYNRDSEYAYIYNTKDGTFAINKNAGTFLTAVNNYPDYLIQTSEERVYSLCQKSDMNEDTESYDGRIVTRPLKLGGSLILKSLRQVKNLVDSDNGQLSMKIYGSNDCKHWQQLRSLGGKPWKYYTFEYVLKGFSAADSFAGTIVDIQARRNDKMR